MEPPEFAGKGRWKYLLDWVDEDKWFPSEHQRYPTRVIRKFERSQSRGDGDSSGRNEAYVKVIINPSIKYDSRWAPIIEMDGRTIYLGTSNVKFQLSINIVTVFSQ